MIINSMISSVDIEVVLMANSGASLPPTVFNNKVREDYKFDDSDEHSSNPYLFYKDNRYKMYTSIMDDIVYPIFNSSECNSSECIQSLLR